MSVLSEESLLIAGQKISYLQNEMSRPSEARSPRLNFFITAMYRYTGQHYTSVSDFTQECLFYSDRVFDVLTHKALYTEIMVNPAAKLLLRTTDQLKSIGDLLLPKHVRFASNPKIFHPAYCCMCKDPIEGLKSANYYSFHSTLTCKKSACKTNFKQAKEIFKASINAFQEAVLTVCHSVRAYAMFPLAQAHLQSVAMAYGLIQKIGGIQPRYTLSPHSKDIGDWTYLDERITDENRAPFLLPDVNGCYVTSYETNTGTAESPIWLPALGDGSVLTEKPLLISDLDDHIRS